MSADPIILLLDLIVLIGWVPLFAFVAGKIGDCGEAYSHSKIEDIMIILSLLVLGFGIVAPFAIADCAKYFRGDKLFSMMYMPIASLYLWLGIFLIIPVVIYFSELWGEVSKLRRDRREAEERELEVIKAESDRRDAEAGHLAVLREEDVAGRLSKATESGRLSCVKS
jgi:hypothetical protein